MDTNNHLQNRTAILAIVALVFVFGVVISIEYFSTNSLMANSNLKRQTAAAASSFYDVSITARSAIVYDANSGEIIYSKNADAQLPLASLTKLMLALVSIQYLPKNHIITITAESLRTEGDTGLKIGEKWDINDLIDATLIPSSNDGAQALALAMGEGSIRQAIYMMNKTARELDLKHTYFINPTGLDESSSMAGAYGSARDIARLLAYIVAEEPSLLDGTAHDGKLLTSINGVELETNNTNEVLGEIPGLIGGKTGYTDLAGGNLAVAFDAGIGRPIIIVVLGSTQEKRFDDVRTLVRSMRNSLQ
jgi:serine-type D-Ala-D-Ala carboxypeptidase (penicillin-binding protein 5/6)